MSQRFALVALASSLVAITTACTQAPYEAPPPPAAECGGADLASDGENCGVCGLSCGGGACSDGVCQEAVIASNQTKASGITVAGDTIYWTTDRAILSCPILGCSEAGPTLLRGDLGAPSNPIVDGDFLYFIHGAYGTAGGSNTGFVPVRIGTDGSGLPLPLLWPGSGRDMVGLAVSKGRIYFAAKESYKNKADAFVADCPAAGCPNNGIDVYNLATDLKGTTTVIVDDKFAYYTEVGTGAIAKASRAQRTTTSLFTAEIAVVALAQDDANLFWGTALPASSSPNVKVQNYIARGPKAGGTREKIAATGEIMSLAVDGDVVYFAEATGRIGRVKKTGSAIDQLAVAQLQPKSLFVYGDYLYWVTQGDGAVHRVRK